MNSAEQYTVDEKNPPSLHFAHGSTVTGVRRGSKIIKDVERSGWYLLAGSVDVNFVPDGTGWLRPKPESK